MNNTYKHITGSVARTLLALTFVFSGFVKAVDPLGTVYKIEDYLKAFGGFFTDLLPLAGVAAVCLITLELVLGVCMVFNVRTNWTAWITLAFYLVMTPLTLYIALTNPVSDCGCFGDAIVLTNWQTFWKNIVLLGLVTVLLCTKQHIPQTFTWQAELCITIVAAGITFGIMGYSYRNLPQIDFRPYKVGNNIPELMEIPDGAPHDIYETTLIYEKDGVEKAFTLADYPKGDSTWTFVEQKSVLVQKGYEPPIHNLAIMTMDYEDITYDILESEDPVNLVILYDLSKYDHKQFDKLMAIVHARPNVYFITGSTEEEIMELAEELGWDEETTYSTFCYADPVTLKTIVRANPGLVVIQNGTIIEKHNMRNIEINF